MTDRMPYSYKKQKIVYKNNPYIWEPINLEQEHGWGLHLLADCKLCVHKRIIDPVNIDWFLRELVKRIDMIPYGDPIIQRFGKDDKIGYTAVQLIETSNIVAHFNDTTNEAFIDVFSCKTFNVMTVLEIIEEFFGCGEIYFEEIIRTTEY